MARLHLFEFEDQSWFPAFLRNPMTDYLQHVTNLFDFYKPVLDVLKRGIEAGGGRQMVDLASGGGGGLIKLSDHLTEAIPGLKIHMTDFYPNIPAFERTRAHNPDVFSYSQTPVDARDVPADLTGLRTQFLSIHHFQPEDVAKILQNAVDARAPIALFEAQKRNLPHLIKFSFAPLFVLLLTPGIRPFRLSRLLLTYLPPLIPLLVWWDGLVSVCRTYHASELKEIVAGVNGSDGYTWEIEERVEKGVTLIYLLGVPRS